MPTKKKVDVETWSSNYYGDRKLATDLNHGYKVLKAAGKGIRPKKMGLPTGFPLMQADTRGIKNRVEFLDAAQHAFEQGYNYALIVALKCCAYSNQAKLPVWIHVALGDAIQLWELGYADSLNDALGLELPSKPKRNFRLFHAQIFLDIVNARDAGVAIDNELFEEVGRHYGDASASKIARIYSELRTVTDEISKNR